MLMDCGWMRRRNSAEYDTRQFDRAHLQAIDAQLERDARNGSWTQPRVYVTDSARGIGHRSPVRRGKKQEDCSAHSATRPSRFSRLRGAQRSVNHHNIGLTPPARATVEDALSRARQSDVPTEPQGDVLAVRIPNPLPAPVRARNRSVQEAGQRTGNLRPRGLEQLGPDATVSDVIGVAQDMRRMTGSQQVAVTSRAQTFIETLGPTVRDGRGNYRLREIIKPDGAPALLQDVLENPARYPLTPEQVQAVKAYQDLVTQVHAEPALFGVKVRTTGLEDGQGYVPRQAAKDTKGAELAKAGGGSPGARLRRMREQGRVFRDPQQAARAGVVHEHPLTAFQSYVRQNLEGAANQHIASMLKTFGDGSRSRRPVVARWTVAVTPRTHLCSPEDACRPASARCLSEPWRAADEAIRESERAKSVGGIRRSARDAQEGEDRGV